MPELPKISGKKAIKVFENLGFEVVRQRGSHVVLRKDGFGQGQALYAYKGRFGQVWTGTGSLCVQKIIGTSKRILSKVCKKTASFYL